MSNVYIGDFTEDSTVNFPFTSSDGSGGAVDPNNPFENSDLLIIKDDGSVQKATTNGITMLSPGYDETQGSPSVAITGYHHVTIDTSNDTGDAGFWTTGSDYFVLLIPDETVDSQTVTACIAHFSIENRSALMSTVAGRKLDVTSTGAAGIDWGNVENQSTAVDLSATDIQLCDTVTDVTNDVGVNEWNGVALSTTNPLPNAAAGAAGGLPTDSTGKTSFNDVSTAEVNAEVDTALADFFTSSAQLVDNIWNEIITSGAHNTADSAARYLRNLREYQGYDNNAVWIDTNNGTAGTTSYENGTVGRPVDTIADANTLAAVLGIATFQIAPESSVTLAATQNNQLFTGHGWTLALGGQDVDGSHFFNAVMSGTATAATEMEFHSCDVGTASVQKATFHSCNFNSTLTMTIAGNYNYLDCQSNAAGASVPIFTKTAGQAITAQWRKWSGDITLSGLEDGDVLLLEGTFGTITLNGTGGSVNIRGTYEQLVDNITGSPTDVNTDGAISGVDIDLILNDTATIKGSGFVESTDSLEAIRDRGDTAWTTGAGGSPPDLLQNTTIATLASQTSFTLTAGSADDNAYNGAMIVVTDSATSTQKAVGTISAYTGSTKTVTLAADPGIFTMAVGDTVDVVAIEANVAAISKDATAADNLELDYDGTGYNKANSTIGTCTTNTDMRGTDSALLAASAPTNFGDLSITATTGRVDVASVAGTAQTANDNGADLNTLVTRIPDTISLANINAEVDTALTDIGLDHLVSAAVAGADITDDSIIAQLVSKSATADWDSFDNTTDSLEAIRDRGDSAWTTGAGGTTPDLLQNTTIATLASQTSFTLTAGSADDDAYNGAIIVVTDSATSTQKAVGRISDYTGSTKTVTLDADPAVFTMAVGDTVDIVATDKMILDYTTTRAGYLDNINNSALQTTVAQTGDSFARLGAPAGASVSADIATIDTVVDDILVDTGTSGVLLAANATSAQLVDDIWDELSTGHLTAGTMGRLLTLAASILGEFTITGTPSSTSLQLTTGSSVDDYYNDMLMVVTSGSAIGQARAITDYDGTTNTLTFDEPLAVTPSSSDTLLIKATHIHPVSEIRSEIDSNSTQLAAIVADTNELQSDWVNGGRLDLILDELTTQGDTNEAAIAALNDLSAAQVNAEIVDALATDTYTEPGQGAPAATASIAAKINYLYKAWRNKTEQTATTLSIYNDAGTTVDQKVTVSDDGTTATKGEVGTGP